MKHPETEHRGYWAKWDRIPHLGLQPAATYPASSGHTPSTTKRNSGTKHTALWKACSNRKSRLQVSAAKSLTGNNLWWQQFWNWAYTMKLLSFKTTAIPQVLSYHCTYFHWTAGVWKICTIAALWDKLFVFVKSLNYKILLSVKTWRASATKL